LFVTGCLLNIAVAEPHIQPLNRSVAFLREKELILSNDAWHIVINLDTSVYEEATATIRMDILSIEKQNTEFTPVSELNHYWTPWN
jgi:hypothetical protein